MSDELTLFDLPLEAPAGPEAEPAVTLPGGRPATAQQEAAVRRRSGSLLLTATAGSGKTAVLVERFVRAVLEDEIAPGRILAITFTDKAAGELRERVRARFLECGAREAARDTEAAFVSTIHGFCARLLRAHALAAGLDPRFTVLDEAQAAAMRDEAFDAALEGFTARGADALDVVAAYGADRLGAMVVSAYESMRSRGEREPVLPEPAPRDVHSARAALERAREAALAELREAAGIDPPAELVEALEKSAALLAAAEVPSPHDVSAVRLTARVAGRTEASGTYAAAAEAYQRACADHHAAPAVRLIAHLLADYGDHYRRLKRERSALDFDDLELEAGRLVATDAAIRTEWAERFELIMVDEFQDTNPRQLGLLESLERDNLFCVGDEMQSIYGFRDADVALFRQRREQLAARDAAVSLTASFRGRPEVVEAVNVAFSTRLSDRFVALEPARDEATGREDPRVELLITDTRGWDDLDEATALGPAAASARPWRRAEAKLLAQRVRELCDGGTSVGDVAVLLRAASDLPVFERALEEQGLPTVSSSGGGFWSRLEVLDLVAYLALVANPLDEHALYSVLASPLVGVSSDALALLATTAQGLGRGAWWTLEAAFAGDEAVELAGLLAPQDRARLKSFAARFAAERRRAPRLTIAALITRAVRDSGYEAGLRAGPGGARRIRNLEKLLHLARGFEDEHGRELGGFLDFAAARSRTPGAEVEAPLAEGDEAAIRVMTIHAAKGLEFDVVCIADLGRAPSLSTPDLLVDGARVGVRLVTLDGRSSVPALAYDELRDARLAADAEEEDRILFVALTRAREHMLMSGAVDVERWPKPSRTAPPISWLAPALAPSVEQQLNAAEPVFDVETEAAGHRTRVRCVLNSPATLGKVLRQPAGVAMPLLPDAEQAPEAWPASAAEPETAVPVAGTAAHEHSGAIVSYSSLAEYARCGYRFYLQRELGLPERSAGVADGGGGGLDARARGVLVHELLEALDFATPELPTATAVQVAAGARGLALELRDAEGVAGLVAGFAASALRGRLAAATDVHREREFTFSLDGAVLVTGVVDVLAWEGDRAALVVDYKSDRVGEGDLPAVVADLYATQQRLYALAALRGGAQTVEVAYCFLERPDEPVTARYATGDVETLVAELRGLASGLLSAEFPVTDTPHRDLCLTCPGRRALCSWPDEMTMRPRPAARAA